MARKRSSEELPIRPREFTSVEEIDAGVQKLERRLAELQALDVRSAVLQDTGHDDVAGNNIRETIREVFGSESPEFREHEHIRIWAGPALLNASDEMIIDSMERGKNQVRGILQGLVARLNEKRDDLVSGTAPSPETYFRQLSLHPRIADVANDLFLDGYHWEAVFAAAKALVNYAKEKSGRHDLDGAPLMRTVFSRNKPVLALNDLASPTDEDEQEGMMHLFEGAVLGIRNPGGHAFPEGTEQRASEYISLLSLLAYRVQEGKRRPSGGPA